MNRRGWPEAGIVDPMAPGELHTAPVQVLAIEDSPADVALLSQLLADSAERFDLAVVASLEEGLGRVASNGIDAVLLDLSLPDSRGIETFTRLRTAAPKLPVVVITALADRSTIATAAGSGVQDYLVKGTFDGATLARAIRWAIERHRLTIALENRARQQAAVASLGQRATATADLQVLYDDAVCRVAETLDVPLCLIAEPAPCLVGRADPGADGRLLLRAGHGWEADAVGNELLPGGLGSCAGFAWLARRPIVARDLVSESRFSLAGLERRHEAKSALATVIGDPAQPSAVFAAYSRSERGFSADDVHFLEGVASLLGSAHARDVAVREQRRLESRLHQSQRLEAVGQLAGGIAHDFSNILTAIVLVTDTLATELGFTHPLAPRAVEIRRAARRASELVTQLLAFGGRAQATPRVLSVNDVVTHVQHMLRRVIGEHVHLVTRLDRRLGQVRADRGQLEQVLVNLAVNARDAMSAGGELTIATAEVDAPPSGAPAAGAHVVLTMSDTGTGMDEATKARIFEPFFTTKPVGKGTGIGLATVYGIVTRAGGTIEVESVPGLGSAFRVYLPRVECADEAESARGGVLATPEGPHLGGCESLLVVEDDVGLHAVLGRTLRTAGYRTEVTSAAAEALGVWDTRPGEFDLVLTDVVMPDMSGLELGRRLRDRSPAARILYMSGHADDAAFRDRVEEGSIRFLPKPFDAETLLRRVRQELDAAPA